MMVASQQVFPPRQVRHQPPHRLRVLCVPSAPSTSKPEYSVVVLLVGHGTNNAAVLEIQILTTHGPKAVASAKVSAALACSF